MKRTNLITGEKVMTEGNALRHYTVLVKRAYKKGDYRQVRQLINLASSLVTVDYCTGCSQDYIDKCRVHDNEMSEQEKSMQYCIPNLIRLWEKEIGYMDNKKVAGHKGKGLRFKSDSTGIYLV